MVACERCRSELPADAVFCARCGRRAVASWATVRAPDEARQPAHTRSPETDDAPGATPGNALSTVAVFCGVVALLNVWIGLAGFVLATGAHRRREPSSRFAIAVTSVGAVLGLAFRYLILDKVEP